MQMSCGGSEATPEAGLMFQEPWSVHVFSGDGGVRGASFYEPRLLS